MKIVSGEVVVAGRLAYVPQQPWIISASIRDNITLGSEFDTDRLNIILHIILATQHLYHLEWIYILLYFIGYYFRNV